MRLIAFIIFAAITVGLVLLLNTKIVAPIPLGAILSPQHGLWQNAEAVDADISENLSFAGLKGKVDVYFDDRLVPHIIAEKDEDVYFVQGYIHAKFRLWQMEFQTHAAAGRVSELLGDTALNFDRQKRRLGMVYAAENSLQEMEKDPETKAICDAYTAGINNYIVGLTEASLPVEYKLLGYKPEKWSNLKTALFLKYMALDLAGYETDFEMTNAKSVFSMSDIVKLYPLLNDSLDPMVPRGTVYALPLLNIMPPATTDSLYLVPLDSVSIKADKPDPANGSNNWAVAGSKTRSGSPILANDPHLGLNLPSLWYELQMSTPTFNAYGVSFPGAPGVIIGFNDSCAFGFTN
ncbi:MAG: penicillin acylase family protein, partial [Chitinophagaceae bacterium]